MNEIVQTVVALAEAIMENPVVAPLVLGAIRDATGYIQKKYYSKTGTEFDKKILAATMTKYLVAVNALRPLLPLVGLPASVAGALTIVVDIGYSTVRKLKNGK